MIRSGGNKMNLFIMLVTLVSAASLTEKAQAGTHCLCQYGAEPVSEQFLFKIGCDMWFKQKTDCTTTSMEQIQETGALALPESDRGGIVKLGYVGHWSDSAETEDFIANVVVPTVTESQVSVEVENTACDPMDDAVSVQNFLHGLILPTGKYVRMWGTQTISVGLWNEVLPGRPNLWAIADSRWTEPQYPTCPQYQDYACNTLEQKGESGFCGDAKNPRTLTCTLSSDGFNSFWR
jgi:hypothetical protein